MEATRLNNNLPVITKAMFTAVGKTFDGENIDGPSVIRIPDWIPGSERPDAAAKYYIYFANHRGSYIRMAWASELQGSWNLFNTGTAANAALSGAITPGNGVLDMQLGNNPSTMDLGINVIGGDLASPDVRIDDVNQRLVLYFHGRVQGTADGSQATYVATSSNGLNFNLISEGGQANHGVRDAALGRDYFRTFEVDGHAFAFANRGELFRGPLTTNAGASATLANADDAGGLWKSPTTVSKTLLWTEVFSPIQYLYENVLGQGKEDARHFAVYSKPARDPDTIYFAYSARFDTPESILLSAVSLAGLTPIERLNPARWVFVDVDPDTPGDQFQIVLLQPREVWEGINRPLQPSANGPAVNVRQLRDPCFFEDTDGSLYLFYTGKGEEAIGIASVSIRAPGIETWRFNNFGISTNSGIAADDADPDDDGVLNIFEYATGTPPLTNSPSPITSAMTGGYLTLTVTKAPVTGVTWSAQSCDDLASWSSASVTVLVDNATTFQVRDNFAITPSTLKRFLRLRLARP